MGQCDTFSKGSSVEDDLIMLNDYSFEDCERMAMELKHSS